MDNQFIRNNVRTFLIIAVMVLFLGLGYFLIKYEKSPKPYANITLQQDNMQNNVGATDPASTLDKPASPAVYNTFTAPPEYKPVACGKVVAVWENAGDSSLVDGYRIYNTQLGRYIEINDPAQTKHEFDPTELGSPNSGIAYTYSIVSFKGALESDRAPAGSVAAITNCNTSDLTPSNKDIIKVRDIALAYEPTNHASDANFTPASLPIRDNDSITFAINIVNGGQKPVTNTVTVADTMHNLMIPNGSINATVLCNNECRLAQQIYDAANNKITFTLAPRTGQSLGFNESWTIIYSARTVAPPNIDAPIYRFQNSASIGFPSEILQTRHIPVVRDSNAPSFYEIQ